MLVIIDEKTFKDKITKKIWEGNFLKKGLSKEIQQRALDEMFLLFSFGTSLERLGAIFGSKNFKSLKGDRKEQHSIRVNDQYRLCFKWENNRIKELEFNKHYWD